MSRVRNALFVIVAICLMGGLLYAQAKQAVATIPGAQLVVLPGLGHGQTMARVDLIAPIVREFLQRAESAQRKRRTV